MKLSRVVAGFAGRCAVISRYRLETYATLPAVTDRHRSEATDTPMNPNVLLSVALVTRNRPIPLERGLASLRAQGEQPFEVIISDDSDDSIAPMIQKDRGRVWLQVFAGAETRFVCQPELCRRELSGNPHTHHG